MIGLLPGKTTIVVKQDRAELDKQHMTCQYFDGNGKTIAPGEVYVLGCGIDVVVEKATSVEMVVFSYDSKPMPIKIEVIKR